MHRRQKKQNKKIDVQAEKIYLVTFIHNIYQIKDEKIYNVKKKKKKKNKKKLLFGGLNNEEKN